MTEPSLSPSLLRYDNWTPRQRTPWGGQKITSHYKQGLTGSEEVVGESWEVSVEPSFPSILTDTNERLDDVIASNPEAWLGEHVVRAYGPQLSLLVKLLDAADNLSVQVHPTADDIHLKADESGKPEAWIILEAEPGAGIYLGFIEGISRWDVEACLVDSGPLDTLMNFVPVKPGDAFVIDAGTVHAIGSGVTLVEPQHVVPGRKGVTYRFWDWNRAYDAQGRRSSLGTRRPLHIVRSLEVTRWDAPGGEAFVESCRATPRLVDSNGDLRRHQILSTPYFATERWHGAGRLTASVMNTFAAVTCVGGAANLSTSTGSLSLVMGQSAVIPAAVESFTLEADGVDLFLSRPQVLLP